MKKLTRDMKHAKIAGVCSGLGKYFGVDPTVVRVVFIIMGMLGGLGVVSYVLSAVVMPVEN